MDGWTIASRTFCATCILAAVAHAAHADPVPTTATPPPTWFHIEVPKSWRSLLDRQTIASDLKEQSHFDGLKTSSGAGTYASPDGAPASGALIVSWVSAIEPASDVGRSLQTQFDRFFAAPEAAGGENTNKIVAKSHKTGDTFVEAGLEWQHTDNETIVVSRAVAYVDKAGHPHFATADCIMQRGVTSAARATCEAAVDTLTVAVTAEKRAPIAPLPAKRAPDRVVAASHDPTQPDQAPRPPTSIGPSSPGVIAIEAPKKPRDYKWLMFIGFGVLAFAFLYTSKGRARAAVSRADPADDNDQGSEEEPS